VPSEEKPRRRRQNAIQSGQHAAARRIEWVIGIASGLLVAGLIGFLAYDGLTATGAHPEFAVETGAVIRAGELYVVTFTLANGGDATAAAVDVVGELARPGASAETATVTFDYVPARSRREGALVFTTDPAGGQLTIRPRGYGSP